MYTGSVLGASAAVGGTTLAVTGFNVTSLAVAAFTLLLVGLALVRLAPLPQR